MLFILPAITSSTRASSIEKWLLMPGPVAADHAELEDDCDVCHEPLSDRLQAELCVACHEEVGQDVKGEVGFHGRLPVSERLECSGCHTDHEGRDAVIVELDEASFDHRLTDFVLRGAHADVACKDCHAPDEPHRQAETECVACHRKDDIHKGQLGDACGDCHSANNWTAARFDHNTTRFPLTGAHALVTCDSCHQSAVFSEVGQTCVACHRSDDVHRGRNGTQCAECHSTSDWANFTFDHLKITGFALKGGHGGLGCIDCHQAKDFRDLGGSDCQTCHRNDDVHKGKLGTNCGKCHGIFQWEVTKFDHGTQGGFPLPAGHDALSCDSCHVRDLHDPLPRTCDGCHADDDVHEGQLGKQCESCHVGTSWTANLWFDHDITSFPLIGAHADVPCDQCHTSAAFHDARNYCVACHGGDDAHGGALGNQCDTCHNPADWLAWQFDHDAQTTFALTGAHIGLPCKACHNEPVKRAVSLPDNCNACHRRDDPHFGRFGNNCESCHTTTSFSKIEGL